MILRYALLVGIGGGTGSILRYLTGLLVNKYLHSNFPFATFIVNMSGCLIIGLLFGLFERYQISGQDLRNLFVTGFCGGFTTFSTFAYENLSLFQSDNPFTALLYIAGSIILSVLFVWIGMELVKI